MFRKPTLPHALAAALLACAAGPAGACLPPPPDYVPPPPPTPEERVRAMVRDATDIVSGVVARGQDRDGRVRFRIVSIHKGKQRPGAILAAYQGWGMNPPMCAGLIPPPPVRKGVRGTVFFYGEPELNFIDDGDLELAFSLGLLRSPRRP